MIVTTSTAIKSGLKVENGSAPETPKPRVTTSTAIKSGLKGKVNEDLPSTGE